MDHPDDVAEMAKRHQEQDSLKTYKPVVFARGIPNKQIGPSIGVWVMKNGTRLPIKDMEDSHLVNTLRMLTRKFCTLAAADNVRFMQITSSCTADDFEIEAVTKWWYEVIPHEDVFYALDLEAQRRGIVWLTPEISPDKRQVMVEAHLLYRTLIERKKGTNGQEAKAHA